MRIAAKQPLFDLIWRAAVIAALVIIPAFAVANQIVHPNPRLIKSTVLLLLMVLMLRMKTVYALYVFILLMPFPSGIALTSTNVILMTLIPLLWVIRATSTKQPLITRTPVDAFIAFFMIIFVVSFINVKGSYALTWNLKMLWRQLTALAFFYLTVRFVDDEKKLMQMTKVIALAAGFLSLTAFIELFAPGRTLIPGWISAGPERFGELSVRTGKIRLEGNVASHSLLGDYLAMSLFFVVYHLGRARNPIEKTIWLLVFGVSFTVVFATANRGAFVALVAGILYSGWVFRRFLNPLRVLALSAAVVGLFVAVQLTLDRFTYAASVTDRLMSTTFEGVVPNNREGAWLPALRGAREHIFVGHGAWYDLGIGLTSKAWPHNAYIYNLYTLGVLGLLAMLLVRYRLFRISFDPIRRHPPGPGRGSAMSLLGIMHVLFVMHLLQMGRTDFERPGDFVYIYIAWLLFGLVVAATRITNQADAQETPAPAGASPPSG